MMIKTISIALISFFLCALCILIAEKKQLGIDSTKKNKPQKMHQKNTPRIGGIGIFFTFLFSMAFYFESRYIFILIGLFFVFLSGIIEDLYDFIRPKIRLYIQTAGIAIMLFSGYGLISNLTPVIILPFYVSILFSLFGICGVCNALNIIDGLNGLASGIALLVLGAIFWVGTDFVQNLALYAIAATFGFFILNFPYGRIFLGDGGAYFLGALIGFLLGILSNEGISAWFGLSVMIYPVWEVIFSILRRKIQRKPAMQPDGAHLHSLLYRLLKHNTLSSFTILSIYAIYLIIILSIAHSAMDYIFASLGFILFYCISYFLLYLIASIKSH